MLRVRPKRIFGVFALLALALGSTAGTAGANPSFDPKTDRETLLLSRSLDGGFPNGPSRNGAFSQDRQLATLAAYESDASDIVAGDVNRTTDVFLVRRARPTTRRPRPGSPGSASPASRGSSPRRGQSGG